ncbi:MAG: hypothetical protein SXA11_05980 [Cyanobacteriota bacterium]|nr:hypothetical protein [Cyanobacteriota bacterium]
MAYSDFTTITKVRKAFDLSFIESQELFTKINPIEPSDYLKLTLKEYVPLANAINTEKARSELIIAPVLLEVRRILNFQIGFFSGVEFNVDSATGLTGFCDYILTASRELYEIRTPVVTMVEAKNENIKGGLGQCIAEMLAARLFNQQQEDEVEAIYGAVTTGNIWKFLKLEKQTIFIDLNDYYLAEIDKILGILAMPFQVKN